MKITIAAFLLTKRDVEVNHLLKTYRIQDIKAPIKNPET